MPSCRQLLAEGHRATENRKQVRLLRRKEVLDPRPCGRAGPPTFPPLGRFNGTSAHLCARGAGESHVQ